jgi:hypothetical protein
MAKVNQEGVVAMGLNRLREALHSLSFVQAAPQIWTRPLDEPTLGWIGLNVGQNRVSNTVDISPLVGVRNQNVERIIANILGESDNGIIPVTVGVNVGYLEESNTFRSFTFGRGPSADAESSRAFLTTMQMAGIPYMQRLRHLTSLAEHLNGPRCRMSEDAAYRRPVVFRLGGKEEEAMQAIEAWEGQLGQRRDPAALRYRRFAEGFREAGSR